MFFGLGTLLSYLSVFFLSATSMTESEVTLMMSFVPIIAFFSSNILAFVSDKFKKHKMILRTVMLMTILLSLLLTYIVKFDSVVLVVIFYVALAFFLNTPGQLTENFALEYSSLKKIPYGRLRLFGSLGFAVAGYVAGILTENFGLQIIFIVFAICMFIPFLLIPKLPDITHDAIEHEKETGVYKKLFTNKSYLSILFASFTVLAAIGVISTFFGIYVREYAGLDLKFIGLIVLVTAGTEIPMMYISDKLIDRFGAYRILAVAAFLNMLRFLAYLLFPIAPVIIFVSLTHGVGYGSAYTAIMHLISENVPSNIRASAISMNATLAIGLGTFLISLIGSRILNARTIFALMAVIELIGVVFCIYTATKEKKELQSL